MRFVHYPDPSPSHGFTIWIDWVCAPYESATEVAVIRPVSLDGVSFIETPIYLIYCLFLDKWMSGMCLHIQARANHKMLM